MSKFNFISKNIKGRYGVIVDSIAGVLMRLKVSPNCITSLGLFFSVLAGVAYALGQFFWGGSLILFSGACDILDGALARKSGKASRLGAFLDSTFDRIGEIFIFLGFIYYYSGIHYAEYYFPQPDGQNIIFAMLAITSSLLVSYIRARGEGLGVDCKVGLLQRPGRMIILVIGSFCVALLQETFRKNMSLFFMILAVLGMITAIQRILYIRKKLLEEDQSC